jgi:hypothetical protein
MAVRPQNAPPAVSSRSVNSRFGWPYLLSSSAEMMAMGESPVPEVRRRRTCAAVCSPSSTSASSLCGCSPQELSGGHPFLRRQTAE